MKKLIFAGKGVDKSNPIEPTQMPRGYGGVAVLWTDKIDHLIRPLDDGAERIQCLELSLPRKSNIIASVYLPTRSNRDATMEFQDCANQIYEICQKYQHTHDIILGGDLNEDLSKNDDSKRYKYLQNLISDYDMKFTCAGKTFTISCGVDCSEIDYFLYKTIDSKIIKEKTILYLENSASDHYPIQLELNCTYSSKLTHNRKENPIVHRKINWGKVDKSDYQRIVEYEINQSNLTAKLDCENMEQAIDNLTSIMKNAAEKCAPKRKTFNTKPKLKVWTPEISSNLKLLRNAIKLWISEV